MQSPAKHYPNRAYLPRLRAPRCTRGLAIQTAHWYTSDRISRTAVTGSPLSPPQAMTGSMQERSEASHALRTYLDGAAGLRPETSHSRTWSAYQPRARWNWPVMHIEAPCG